MDGQKYKKDNKMKRTERRMEMHNDGADILAKRWKNECMVEQMEGKDS